MFEKEFQNCIDKIKYILDINKDEYHSTILHGVIIDCLNLIDKCNNDINEELIKMESN